jgi:predicted lipoprotein with Yx(FWY)xxD motif
MRQQGDGARRLGRKAAILAAGLTGGLAAVAFAAGHAKTVVTASQNAKLSETVVVNGVGLTLYSLSPETTHHLLCKTNQCFSFWPPLIVHSRHTKIKAGPGVDGHLRLLSRGHGKFQVTLRGMPLYRFSGDSAPGDANGEGIMSFGGTWHAVTASANAPAATSPAATTTTTSTTPAMSTTTTTQQTTTMSPGVPYVPY